MPKDLNAFFSPKSVAIIGASRDPKKVGAIILKNILDSKFPGKIYPINPNTPSLNNLTCFPDIPSLPEIPDLAIVALPASLVLATLQQLSDKGVKNAVVLAAGFKEIGEEGKKLEEELANLADKYQINLLGPNCLGFVNNLCPINATFGEAIKEKGNLCFISQSGAIAASLFDWCNSTGLGLNQFVTLGNKAILNENDILDYLKAQNTDLSPIGLYLESISQGSEFVRLAQDLSKQRPLFIIKPGKTPSSQKAMQSHTGAIAGEDAVLNTALKQAGVIRCSTLENFFDLAKAFSWAKIPEGPRVAIISNAGGPAVISADAVAASGLKLAEIDSTTQKKLAQVLPKTASFLNPIDVLGDALAERFFEATEIILQNDQIDSVIVILTPQMMTESLKTAEMLSSLSQKYSKTLLCAFMGGSLVKEAEVKLNQSKIACFPFPERAITVLAQMWQFRENTLKKTEVKNTEPEEALNAVKIKEIISTAQQRNQKTLDNITANNLIAAANITTPPTIHANNFDKALNFAQTYGFPVVLKLSSPGLIHKKAIGGVITDIKDEIHLEKAWDLLERKITQQEGNLPQNTQIQIQKAVSLGMEVIAGIKDDPVFGKVMLFGAGGSLAELIADRNLHLLPLNKSSAQELVQQSKVFPLLQGQDHHPPLALEALYQALVNLSQLAESLSEVSDLEINPLIVTLNDVWAVDAKVILKIGEQNSVAPPKFQSAKVVSHLNLASTYHYLEFEQETPFTFKPGQYVSVKVANDRLNCYSIAGHPSHNRFNLLVDIKPGGPGSKFFEHLKVGEKISYLGQFGNFTLNLNDGAEKYLFLATGSGLAPMKPLMEQLLMTKPEALVYLYFGVSFVEDVFGIDYFMKLASRYPNFRYKVAVWKPKDDWKGYRGFITDLVKADFPQASDCAVYLCGNKTMIQEASNMLLSKGCPKERIYTEKY